MQKHNSNANLKSALKPEKYFDFQTVNQGLNITNDSHEMKKVSFCITLCKKINKPLSEFSNKYTIQSSFPE